MRLLIANPNTTQAMTDGLERTAKAIAAPGVEIMARTAPRGFPYISTIAEAQISGVVAMEMIAEAAPEIDAAIVAAFGDPGLKAARQAFDFPVIGMAEAAIQTANLLGERFAIVTFAPRMRGWFTDQVHATGLAGRFAGVRTPESDDIDIAKVGPAMADELAKLVRLAAEEDGADVVILGGAPLAGVAHEIRDAAPAVLIDPIAAAVKLAEALVALAPAGANKGRFARPPGKPSTGLDPVLAKWMARRSGWRATTAHRRRHCPPLPMGPADARLYLDRARVSSARQDAETPGSGAE